MVVVSVRVKMERDATALRLSFAFSSTYDEIMIFFRMIFEAPQRFVRLKSMDGKKLHMTGAVFHSIWKFPEEHAISFE